MDESTWNLYKGGSTQDHEVRCAQQTEKTDVGVWIDMQIVLCIDCVSCDRLNLRMHSWAAPMFSFVNCWFAWTLGWIPGVDSLKLLALIARRNHIFRFCQLQRASVWRRAHPFWAQRRRREATPRRPFSTALTSTWRTFHRALCLFVRLDIRRSAWIVLGLDWFWERGVSLWEPQFLLQRSWKKTISEFVIIIYSYLHGWSWSVLTSSCQPRK